MNRYVKIAYAAMIGALIFNNTVQSVAPEHTSGQCSKDKIAHAAPCTMSKSTIGLCVLGAIWFEKSVYDLWYTLPELDAQIVRLAQMPVKTAAEALPYLCALSERAFTRSFVIGGLFLVPATAAAYYVTYRLEKAQHKKHVCGAQK